MKLHWPLAMIFSMFLAPVIGAMCILYFGDFSSARRIEHGTLIQPAQQLTNSDFKIHKWQIVYLKPKVCTTECENQQQALSKLHIALGADKDRVLVSTSDSARINIQEKDGSILIIDPLGFYIMHYAPGSKLNGLLKDLKRLLKYSHAT